MATTELPPQRSFGRVRLHAVDPDLVDGASAATVAVAALPAGQGGAALERMVRTRALVVKGVLLRKVVVGDCTITEIVGPGDIVTGHPRDNGEALPKTVEWQVLERALIADLSTLETSDIRADAAIMDVTARRLQDQLDRASVRCAITTLIRVDLRLLAYLWHLAESFGVVTPAGVKLELPLTHAMLAQLIGARRPTVTTALQRLAERGFLLRDSAHRFVLCGDPVSSLQRARED